MKCPHCGSPVYSKDFNGTDDWTIIYKCGTIKDDNGMEIRGQQCLKTTHK